MPNTKKFDFPNPTGRVLAGRLETPQGPARGAVLFAHCFTCSKNVRAASQVSRKLAAHGFAVLRFDFTGLGDSEGEFSNTDFSSNVADLVAAAAAMRDQDMAPGLLVGHSLGGAAVIAAAGEIEEVRAVATIGAPSSPAHVVHLFADQERAIEAEGKAEVSVGGRRFSIRRDFLEDVRRSPLSDRLGRLKRALLIMHSPQDSVVGIENAEKLYHAARHPKSFIALDGADHMLTNEDDAGFVADILAAWSARYL